MNEIKLDKYLIEVLKNLSETSGTYKDCGIPHNKDKHGNEFLDVPLKILKLHQALFDAIIHLDQLDTSLMETDPDEESEELAILVAQYAILERRISFLISLRCFFALEALATTRLQYKNVAIIEGGKFVSTSDFEESVTLIDTEDELETSPIKATKVRSRTDGRVLH